MTDKALVIRIDDNGFAYVKIDAQKACNECSARHICSGLKNESGLLVAVNPMGAKTGDEVTLNIPEGTYNRDLILLFGVLLTALVLGTVMGYLLSPIFHTNPSKSGLFGLFLILIPSGVFLFRYLKKKSRIEHYPVIIDILNKGVRNG
ncbi:MAG: SoxR reducing system RseC family protein [Candidatus Aminicenantes bacterium]|nr:SoxR reducing system RseC family protein [Candidatus Aminicenantes bacterium]